MFAPKGHNDHKKLLTAEMLLERTWLSKNAPVCGVKITDEYISRVIPFNAECKRIGATLMCLVETQC